MSLDPISTKDIPQADSLEKVVLAAQAVSQGNSTFQEIASYLELTDRQGRYYRRAAEILRFVARASHSNLSTLTPLGHDLLRGDAERRKQLLTTQVLGVPIVQSVVGMLTASNGTATQRDLKASLWKIVSNTTQGMAERRLMTIISWLESLDIVRKSGEYVMLRDLPSSINKIEISDPETPVLPKPTELRLFEEVSRRATEASAIIRFEVNRAKLERANVAHERLRSLLAEKIKRSGFLPTYNKYIDLAVRISDQNFLIEAKSSANIRVQVRRGLSQLYEYRYLQCLPNAVLILLLEKPLAGVNEWLLDYLIRDRGIYVIWDAVNDELFTTDEGRQELPFMR